MVPALIYMDYMKCLADSNNRYIYGVSKIHPLLAARMHQVTGYCSQLPAKIGIIM